MNFELQQRIADLEKRVTQLEINQSRNPSVPPTGTIQRGKYLGKTHAFVIQNDPASVIWLFEHNYAAGMGYLSEHLEQAKEVLAQSNRSLR